MATLILKSDGNPSNRQEINCTAKGVGGEVVVICGEPANRVNFRRWKLRRMQGMGGIIEDESCTGTCVAKVSGGSTLRGGGEGSELVGWLVCV